MVKQTNTSYESSTRYSENPDTHWKREFLKLNIVISLMNLNNMEVRIVSENIYYKKGDSTIQASLTQNKSSYHIISKTVNWFANLINSN